MKVREPRQHRAKLDNLAECRLPPGVNVKKCEAQIHRSIPIFPLPTPRRSLRALAGSFPGCATTSSATICEAVMMVRSKKNHAGDIILNAASVRLSNNVARKRP